MSEEPIRVYVGTFPIAKDVVIPLDVLQRADAEIEAERSRRHALAVEKAQREAAEAAAKRKTWRGWLGALWRRWKP